ncbi:hypothetical protein BDZ45DRAFT_696047 [Acephala macrosclerotiorum]|nr:hypothetical protein BDZ45DRAFT_696047 [Acephala macrosclerotiorum]
MKERDEKEHTAQLDKAKRKLFQAVNKAKKEMSALGVQARKDEKARLARHKAIQRNGDFLELVDLTSIRQLNKNPTLIEAMKMTEDFYLALQAAVKQLEAQGAIVRGVIIEEADGDVEFSLGATEEAEEDKEDRRRRARELLDSSPPPLQYEDSLDVESYSRSINLIQGNAYFNYQNFSRVALKF